MGSADTVLLRVETGITIFEKWSPSGPVLELATDDKSCPKRNTHGTHETKAPLSTMP